MRDAVEQLLSDGFCVLPKVLDRQQTRAARAALWQAADESERRGVPTFIPELDPNAANVRVFNLLDLDALFRELIMHPVAVALVESLLGVNYLISNFTANIARPGSQSMQLHSDQAIVVPEPWENPWSVNVIWCLDEVTADNGGTLYLPGSHLIQRQAELPPNARDQMRAFTAAPGSIIAMDGRVWHTSGANITTDQERALLFGYYSMDFLRPQVNWNASLSTHVIETLPPALFDRLGLGAAGNVRHGAALTRQG